MDTIFDHNKRYRYLILISFLDKEEKIVLENNPTSKVSLRLPAERGTTFFHFRPNKKFTEDSAATRKGIPRIKAPVLGGYDVLKSSPVEKIKR